MKELKVLYYLESSHSYATNKELNDLENGGNKVIYSELEKNTLIK